MTRTILGWTAFGAALSLIVAIVGWLAGESLPVDAGAGLLTAGWLFVVGGMFAAWYRYVLARSLDKGKRVPGKASEAATEHLVERILGRTLASHIGNLAPVQSILFEYEVGEKSYQYSQVLFADETPLRDKDGELVVWADPDHPRRLKTLVYTRKGE